MVQGDHQTSREAAEGFLERKAEHDPSHTKARHQRTNIHTQTAQGDHDENRPADLGGDAAEERAQKLVHALRLQERAAERRDEQLHGKSADDQDQNRANRIQREGDTVLRQPRRNLLNEFPSLVGLLSQGPRHLVDDTRRRNKRIRRLCEHHF